MVSARFSVQVRDNIWDMVSDRDRVGVRVNVRVSFKVRVKMRVKIGVKVGTIPPQH